jgi:hypothetical protein
MLYPRGKESTINIGKETAKTGRGGVAPSVLNVDAK